MIYITLAFEELLFGGGFGREVGIESVNYIYNSLSKSFLTDTLLSQPLARPHQAPYTISKQTNTDILPFLSSPLLSPFSSLSRLHHTHLTSSSFLKPSLPPFFYSFFLFIFYISYFQLLKTFDILERCFCTRDLAGWDEIG